MSKLDEVIEQYNKVSNFLESEYLKNRDEQVLTMILDKDALESLFLGTACVDNHIITGIKFDGRDMKVSLEKI